MSIFAALDSLAQQVEHNTFNVGVLGSSPRRITEKKSALQFCKAGFVFEVWGITLSPYFLRSYLPVLYIFSLSFFTCQHVSIQHQIQQMLKQCTATKRESVASLFVGRTRVAGKCGWQVRGGRGVPMSSRATHPFLCVAQSPQMIDIQRNARIAPPGHHFSKEAGTQPNKHFMRCMKSAAGYQESDSTFRTNALLTCRAEAI